MRKIMILKMTREKSNAFENLLKINFFLDDIENVKNNANILKTYFFGFLLFFAIFEFSKNFIKKVG